MTEKERKAAHHQLAKDGEVTVTPHGGDPLTVTVPEPWLMELVDVRAEMGCDRSGRPFATCRFAVLDEERVVDPSLRRLARRLWRAADQGASRGLEEQLKRD